MMHEFFYMGGYALYVWSAYSLAFIVLIINIINPYFTHKNNLKSARDFQQLNGNNSDDT